MLHEKLTYRSLSKDQIYKMPEGQHDYAYVLFQHNYKCNTLSGYHHTLVGEWLIAFRIIKDAEIRSFLGTGGIVEGKRRDTNLVGSRHRCPLKPIYANSTSILDKAEC